MSKILIIEDENSVLEAIAAYLRKEDYEVFTADRGYKGLEYAGANVYGRPRLQGA